METKKIEATKNTPEIILDEEQGLIELSGRSYAEDSYAFYKPIIEWLNEYFSSTKNQTTVNIKLTYYNSTTSQILFEMLDIVNKEHKSDTTINWYYDGNNPFELDDIEDYSEEFQDLQIVAVTF